MRDLEFEKWVESHGALEILKWNKKHYRYEVQLKNHVGGCNNGRVGFVDGIVLLEGKKIWFKNICSAFSLQLYYWHDLNIRFAR